MPHIATWKQVKEGLVSDIYFERTKKSLKQREWTNMSGWNL